MSFVIILIIRTNKKKTKNTRIFLKIFLDYDDATHSTYFFEITTEELKCVSAFRNIQSLSVK